MKAVLDTNVFISGIFWSGASRESLELWRDGKYALVASLETISEIETVLKDFKIRLPDDLISAWIDLVISNCIMVEPVEKIDAVSDDPDDNMFLEAAVAAEADYIVSQDNHLLKIKEFRGTKIVKPEEFNRLFS
ncbi:MAG: putative toxin-antitoxin system toxin component, PIN family [Candidatus Altiarchaeia archaeon]